MLPYKWKFWLPCKYILHNSNTIPWNVVDCNGPPMLKRCPKNITLLELICHVLGTQQQWHGHEMPTYYEFFENTQHTLACQKPSTTRFMNKVFVPHSILESSITKWITNLTWWARATFLILKRDHIVLNWISFSKCNWLSYHIYSKTYPLLKKLFNEPQATAKSMHLAKV